MPDRTITEASPPPASNDVSLMSLSLSGVDLMPAFSTAVTSYTATVAYDVMETMVSAGTNDDAASYALMVGGKAVDDDGSRSPARHGRYDDFGSGYG